MGLVQRNHLPVAVAHPQRQLPHHQAVEKMAVAISCVAQSVEIHAHM